MPRNKTNPVHRYFTFNQNEGKSECKLCGIKVKGSHVTNLKNHMLCKHQKESNEVHNILTESQKENCYQSPIKRNIQATVDKLLNACVRLVAVHGRPLSLIDDEAFQNIIELVVKEEYNVNINSQKIRNILQQKTYEVKRKISKVVKGKMISLKLDSATCLDRNFVGINMQYAEGNKIIIRNLVVSEIFDRQTAENLKKLLLETLLEYNISTKQIYSITTDNGANYVKMKELLNSDEDECIEVEDENNFQSENPDNDNTADIEYDFDFSEEGLSAMGEANAFYSPEFVSSFEIRSISCAQHTLQLAIKDGLKNDESAQKTIEIVRAAVKILKRPTSKNYLRRIKRNMPIIDNSTRWNSTFNMLSRLMSLQEICADMHDVSQLIDENTWSHISEILTSLEPVYEATLRLQKEQLCLSDFYVVWLICKNKLEQTATVLSMNILNAMKLRETSLLNNKAFLSAIFMDLRLNVILSDDEVTTAIAYLKETYRQISLLENEEADDRDEANTADNSLNEANSGGQKDLADLELFLQNTERVRNVAPELRDNLDLVLHEIRAGNRLPLTTNIVDYWCGKSFTSPKASKLALVVLCVPATQVSVERLFSSLKFVLSPLRYNLIDSLVKDILILRHNKDLF